MKGSDSPCLICEKREIGCHSSCMRYAEYKLRLQAMNQQKRLDATPYQANIFDISPVFTNHKKPRRRKRK